MTIEVDSQMDSPTTHAYYNEIVLIQQMLLSQPNDIFYQVFKFSRTWRLLTGGEPTFPRCIALFVCTFSAHCSPQIWAVRVRVCFPCGNRPQDGLKFIYKPRHSPSTSYHVTCLAQKNRSSLYRFRRCYWQYSVYIKPDQAFRHVCG